MMEWARGCSCRDSESILSKSRNNRRLQSLIYVSERPLGLTVRRKLYRGKRRVRETM